MDALKILVVDDESRMRKLVKDFLIKKNFQVLEAGDGLLILIAILSGCNMYLFYRYI